MTTVLQINASLFSEGGQSSRLAAEFVQGLHRRNPGLEVVVRDLARDPIPHLDAARFQAFVSKPAERSAAQQAVIDQSNELIEEIRRADIVVIGLPMYNFGLPTQLKAYFDHIARAGVTFRYTEQGSVGLLTGKTAYVFAARGGRYAGTPRETQTGYVREFLSFVGIEQVEFVYAEGLAISEAAKQSGIAAAQAALRDLLTPERLAA